MVIDSYAPFFKLTAEVARHVFFFAVYICLIGFLDLQYHFEELNFPVSIVAILGTVIGLLLAFRTNSCYSRWWEARILWGAIVNDSRTWVRQLIEFTCDREDTHANESIRTMALRQSAWCYALTRFLRKQDPMTDITGLVADEEIESYSSSHHVPNSLLLTQGRELREIYLAGKLELFQFIELERTLVRLTNSMGGCERIRNTVFPTSYTRLVTALIYTFVLFIPFGLVSVPAIVLVATSILLAFAFLLINQVSIYMQDPFSNRPSDTPMLALSRTIEINIREMLDEDHIPEPFQPVGGILY